MQGIQKELLLINRRLDSQKIDVEKINARLLNMEQSNNMKESRVREKTSNLYKEERSSQRNIEDDQLTYMGCSNDQFQMDSFSSSFRDTQVNDTALPGVSLSTGGFIKTSDNLCQYMMNMFFSLIFLILENHTRVPRRLRVILKYLLSPVHEIFSRYI